MRFEKPKGQRLHKQFFGITNHEGLWWNEDKSWSLESKHGSTSLVSCRSLRAFRRHLRKHPEIRGKAVLVSRFRGYNIYV